MRITFVAGLEKNNNNFYLFCRLSYRFKKKYKHDNLIYILIYHLVRDIGYYDFLKQFAESLDYAIEESIIAIR